MVEKEEWKVVKGADLKGVDGGPLRTRIVHHHSQEALEELVESFGKRAHEALWKYRDSILPDRWSVKMGHNSKEEVEVIQSAMNIIWQIEGFLALSKYPNERWNP